MLLFCIQLHKWRNGFRGLSTGSCLRLIIVSWAMLNDSCYLWQQGERKKKTSVKIKETLVWLWWHESLLWLSEHPPPWVWTVIAVSHTRKGFESVGTFLSYHFFCFVFSKSPLWLIAPLSFLVLTTRSLKSVTRRAENPWTKKRIRWKNILFSSTGHCCFVNRGGLSSHFNWEPSSRGRNAPFLLGNLIGLVYNQLSCPFQSPSEAAET